MTDAGNSTRTPPGDNWVKSSLSFANGNCVQVAWLGSSLSHANGNCVQVADLPDDVIGVRNSRHVEAEGPILMFTRGEWEAFVAGVKNGEFDLGENGGLAHPSAA